MDKIIIVDDDEFMREGLEETLSGGGFALQCCKDGESALRYLSDGSASLLVTDMRMPGMSGMELLEKVRKLDPKLPVVMMTAFATIETAVEAMKKGAFDYIMKPFDAAQIEVVVQKALEHRRLLMENEYLRKELAGRWSVEDFVGECPQMQEAFRKIRQIAASSATVFIRGESGTGKELVARAIHTQSPRREKPMVRVNCAALSAGVLESELFGHEKGAFTGADRRRIGRFEMADGGTIFLDEVSEMDLNLQGKLLRVLQEKEFERVGSSETIRADVRILASSNRDMEKAIAEGSFRQDLYYRLNVVTVELPPLRDRRSDVRTLVRYFIAKYNRDEGTRIKHVAEESYRLLEAHHWPGNVRELENLVERAIVLGDGESLSHEVIAASMEPRPGAAIPSATCGAGEGVPEAAAVVAAPTCFQPRPLEDIECEHIRRMLEHFEGHRVKTAQALGISERSLRDRIKRWPGME